MFDVIGMSGSGWMILRVTVYSSLVAVSTQTAYLQQPFGIRPDYLTHHSSGYDASFR
jgi:hypothetical protein